MATKEIITKGNALLSKKCHLVTKFDKKLWEMLDNMKETLIASNGVGLAAPQLGIIRRVALVLDVTLEEEGKEPVIYELINPEIIEKSDETIIDVEGCLSVPGIYGKVERPAKAKVRAQDRNGKIYEVEGKEITARCFCHELDHLDGHLFTEKVIEFIYPEDDE